MFNLLADGSNGTGMILILIAVFVVSMIFSSRQQRKRQKEIEETLNAVQPGHKVKTIGGICGVVVEVCPDDNTIVLETGTEKSGKSYITFDKQAVYQTDALAVKEETAVETPVVATPATPAPVVTPVQASTSEFVIEEYAEAMPYDGGPVEGVEVAKEVNPTTFVAPQGRVQTAGYDFYNCKSFDPFIAILNNEERNQFTELFILKYKGVMPEIPDYEVGGDNKAFFRKLFIYLGQYRDRIPDSLLSKIYQFAIKM